MVGPFTSQCDLRVHASTCTETAGGTRYYRKPGENWAKVSHTMAAGEDALDLREVIVRELVRVNYQEPEGRGCVERKSLSSISAGGG